MREDLREERKHAVLEAIEDDSARVAAIGQRRLMMDSAFRRRYGRYLRGEITYREALGTETHDQWYDRVTRRGDEDAGQS